MSKQKFNSKGTSLNQIACLFKSKWAEFKPDDVVLDYGGGKYDTTAEYMRDKVRAFYTVDEYNRTAEWNAHYTAKAVAEGVNVITCANVLNVIAEDDIVDEVIRKVSEITSERAVFCVYVGDKSGNGKQTGEEQWQRNEPATAYVGRIAKYFSSVKRHGNIIVASK